MDYSRIVAREATGTLIGQLYVEADPTVTREASAAYFQFVQEIREQFAYLVGEGVRFHFTDDDPYEDASAMMADAAKGHLAIYKTQEDQSHPLMCNWDNNRFRAVHDYFGHYASGRDFSRHGEEAAWVAHSQMFSPLARRAMTSETRGQNSAFIWLNGGKEFPAQKAVLLPEWVSEIPAEWL